MKSFKEVIVRGFWEASRTLRRLAHQAEILEQVAKLWIQAYRGGKKVVLFGNGGSAADAQHIAAELVARFGKHRRSLPALALTTNTSTLTAIANDYDYESVFSRQVESLVNPGDVVVALSTSGNSANVLAGVHAAKKRRARVVGFTGQAGGKLKGMVDICIQVPSHETPHIQEGHITSGHILCDLVERSLFKK